MVAMEEYYSLMDICTPEDRRKIALIALAVYEGDGGYDRFCEKDQRRDKEIRELITGNIIEMDDSTYPEFIRRCREDAGYCDIKETIIDGIISSARKKMDDYYPAGIPEDVSGIISEEENTLKERYDLLPELVSLHHEFCMDAGKRGIPMKLISPVQLPLIMNALGNDGPEYFREILLKYDVSVQKESRKYVLNYDVSDECLGFMESVIKRLFPNCTVIRRGKDNTVSGYSIVFGTVNPGIYQNIICRFDDGTEGWEKCPRKLRSETIEIITNSMGG